MKVTLTFVSINRIDGDAWEVCEQFNTHQQTRTVYGDQSLNAAVQEYKNKYVPVYWHI
jgi:ribulose bisphosphate carboxylase small subunit